MSIQARCCRYGTAYACATTLRVAQVLELGLSKFVTWDQNFCMAPPMGYSYWPVWSWGSFQCIPTQTLSLRAFWRPRIDRRTKLQWDCIPTEFETFPWVGLAGNYRDISLTSSARSWLSQKIFMLLTTASLLTLGERGVISGRRLHKLL